MVGVDRAPLERRHGALEATRLVEGVRVDGHLGNAGRGEKKNVKLCNSSTSQAYMSTCFYVVESIGTFFKGPAETVCCRRRRTTVALSFGNITSPANATASLDKGARASLDKGARAGLDKGIYVYIYIYISCMIGAVYHSLQCPPQQKEKSNRRHHHNLLDWFGENRQ